MKSKLDGDGIILLTSFMQLFFPHDIPSYLDSFPLYHYNGLPRSNPDNQVKYHYGLATLLECNESPILESNDMLTILQTKWPSVDVQWDNQRTPSVN